MSYCMVRQMVGLSEEGSFIEMAVVVETVLRAERVSRHSIYPDIPYPETTALQHVSNEAEG